MGKMTLQRRIEELLANNDPNEAIPELLRCYGPLLHKILAWLPIDVREGIINDALFKAWIKREQFDPKKGSFSVWFCRIARYAAIDRWRLENKAKRRQRDLERRREKIEEIRRSEAFKQFRASLSVHLGAGKGIFKGLQRAVLLADLESLPEAVDSSKLADLLRTTRDSIYSQRTKAYKKLEKLGLADPRKDPRFQL